MRLENVEESVEALTLKKKKKKSTIQNSFLFPSLRVV